MKKRDASIAAVLGAAVLFSAAACRGSAPLYYGESSIGFSAILLRARILLPEGETEDGRITMNLESEDGDERYRVAFLPGKTSLLRVEPGLYRLYPPRDLFGFPQTQVKVRVQNRTYSVPFPRELLRMESFSVKPAKAFPIGVLEARLIPMGKKEKPKVVLRLDHGVAVRRALVQDVISKMMDPKTPQTLRDSAITWTRALEQALVKIQGEEERAPSYKPSP
ncbi:MAG TPA: hypothetical protein DCM05_14465 [Elusimicrobia bacterium]|nr:hypothetical protein [Elusimicrobiota bacterium]